MATNPADIHAALVKAGVDQAAADAIARGAARPAGPSAMSILTGATMAGFTLIGLGLGWVKSDLADVRTELRTEIAANRDRIDAVDVRLVGVEGRLAGVEERLMRMETLLEERLPPGR